jgi:putative FmdB family regulatory protein
MPIYEYRCTDCGEKFEKFVRLGHTPGELECPACRSRQVAKAFSVFSTSGLASRSESGAGRAACSPVGT